MNSTLTNSSNSRLILRFALLLLITFSLSTISGKVQAAPQSTHSLDYNSSHRCLIYRTILHRLDFGLSDGKGNGYGIPGMSATNDANPDPLNMHRLDFALSDGKGNGYGLPESIMASENKFPSINWHRLDFALSDGKGNGYGLPDSSISYANKLTVEICR